VLIFVTARSVNFRIVRHVPFTLFGTMFERPYDSRANLGPSTQVRGREVVRTERDSAK
jgi:hypothetical protein